MPVTSKVFKLANATVTPMITETSNRSESLWGCSCVPSPLLGVVSHLLPGPLRGIVIPILHTRNRLRLTRVISLMQWVDEVKKKKKSLTILKFFLLYYSYGDWENFLCLHQIPTLFVCFEIIIGTTTEVSLPPELGQSVKVKEKLELAGAGEGEGVSG